MCDLSLFLEEPSYSLFTPIAIPYPFQLRHTLLILFPFPLPIFQVSSVKNALLVSMEIQEFLEHLAGHVPATTTLI